ncbi:exosome non-catalytic core subunit rrp40 [Saxophila tyrrhenica]|uniref:Exosome non-catalytic core subunit rrp40 n=1 Tax=Saxophila tyrrhenica TaxID=1690608 RepID=A0AAV9NX70_9PEZI|nr:exosome non-catalytic core subunit rrp40 [Saxophila tyrrhenica]
MATTSVLLPGEQIPPSDLPPTKKGTLTLGPNLRHLPPSTILTTTSGSLHTDPKKAALWIDAPHGRYQPSVGDLVVAQIHHGSTDTYHCALTPHTAYALLGQLAFEGANKKTRPKLESGDLVYARVKTASKWEDVEIECFNSSTGKADGLGPLKGGMVFNISPAFARRLMMGTDKEGRSKGGVVVLEEVGEKVKFEVAVGRNGRVWVDSGNVAATLVVGRLLMGCDEKGWSVEEQRREIETCLRPMF